MQGEVIKFALKSEPKIEVIEGVSKKNGKPYKITKTSIKNKEGKWIQVNDKQGNPIKIDLKIGDILEGTIFNKEVGDKVYPELRLNIENEKKQFNSLQPQILEQLQKLNEKLAVLIDIVGSK